MKFQHAQRCLKNIQDNLRELRDPTSSCWDLNADKLASQIVGFGIEDDEESNCKIKIYTAGAVGDRSTCECALKYLTKSNAAPVTPDDVIQTGLFLPMMATGTPGAGGTKPPKPGSPIGFRMDRVFPTPTVGALGGIVSNGQTKFILTANHVISLNDWVPKGSEVIFDPLSFPTGGVIGNLSPSPLTDRLVGDKINKSEFALAEVKQDVVLDPSFPFPVQAAAGEPQCHGRVMKYSVLSGRTTGELVCRHISLELRFDFGRFQFDNQLLIKGGASQFARPGDSGSLVFLESGEPVGMLFAGSVDSGWFVACPLKPFFDKHKLSLVTGAAPGRSRKRPAQKGRSKKH